jgi:antagonist of KipI
MSLKIIKAGILDTLQDKGRFGQQYLGINPTGCMDVFAATIANFLVQNTDNEIVIELHYPTSSFLFLHDAFISLSGADFFPSIDGQAIPLYQPIVVRQASVLKFEQWRSGRCCYMAIRGGIKTDLWLGSGSTHLKAKIGGFEGRALQKNDTLHFNKNDNYQHFFVENQFKILPWRANDDWGDPFQNFICVTLGREWNWLTEQSKLAFENQQFSITNRSDRMGYTLESDGLIRDFSEELLSSGVDFGTVQLLPSGQLIVLMADHQTTGGYPRIAHVATAHRHKLAQKKANDTLKFKIITLETAESLLVQQQRFLSKIKLSCNEKSNFFKS